VSSRRCTFGLGFVIWNISRKMPGASIASGKAEGEVFSPQDSAALAAAIMRLCTRLADSHARAAKLAKAFARKHSAEAYVDLLLAHAAR